LQRKTVWYGSPGYWNNLLL